MRWREHETTTTISDPTLNFLALWWTTLTLSKRIHFCNQKYLEFVITLVSSFLIVHPNVTVNWLGRELGTFGDVQINLTEGLQKQRRRVRKISEIELQNQFTEKCWQLLVDESLLFALFDIFGHSKQYRAKQTAMQTSSSTHKYYQRLSRRSALLSTTDPTLTLTMGSSVR